MQNSLLLALSLQVCSPSPLVLSSCASPIHPWQALPLGIWYCRVPLFISLGFLFIVVSIVPLHAIFSSVNSHMCKLQGLHVEVSNFSKFFFFCTRFSFMAAFVRLLSLLVLVLHRFRNKAELVSECLSCGLSPRTCSVLHPFSTRPVFSVCVAQSHLQLHNSLLVRWLVLMRDRRACVQ